MSKSKDQNKEQAIRNQVILNSILQLYSEHIAITQEVLLCLLAEMRKKEGDGE